MNIDQFLSAVAGLGAIAALGTQAYSAYKGGQWWKLVGLAGEVTYQFAGVVGMTNDEKRRAAEVMLYDQVPVQLRRLFTKEQFSAAVEYGWEMLAKPRLVADKPAKAA